MSGFFRTIEEVGPTAHEWAAFLADTQAIEETLAALVPQLAPLPDVMASRHARGPWHTPWTRTPGAFRILRSWPSHGLQAVVAQDSGNAAAALPFVQGFSQHTATLTCVEHSADGAQARVSLNVRTGRAADADIIPLTLYDLEFAYNRNYYARGDEASWAMWGLAHSAAPAANYTMTIPRPTTYGGSGDPDDTIELVFDELLTLLSIDGLPDRYRYRARVTRVREEHNSALGRKCLIVRCAVLGTEPELKLDIVLTDLVWAPREPPEVGSYIEGTLWLVGMACTLLARGALGPDD